MPSLDNPKHETFAQARARGALLDDAFEDAGYAPNRGHPLRLAARPEVAARIAEPRAERRTREADLAESDPTAIIAALVRAARDPELLKTPAGVKEARENLLAARQLALALTRERALDRGKVLSFNEELDRLAEKAVPPPSNHRPPAGQPASPDRPAIVLSSSGDLPQTFQKPAMTCQASPGAGLTRPRSLRGVGPNVAGAITVAPPSRKRALLGGWAGPGAGERSGRDLG